MNASDELRLASSAMAAAAAQGRWDEVIANLWRRADALEGLRGGGGDEDSLAGALRDGETTWEAARRLRAEIETELQNLRAARRSAGSWRPYREAKGGTLDVQS